jgi:hypothetical protein
MGMRFLFINKANNFPTIVTLRAYPKDDEYLAKYPTTQGYEWIVLSTDSYNKPVTLDRDFKIQWEQTTVMLNDPGNINKQ